MSESEATGWKDVSNPPHGEKGRWTDRVAVYTSWGNVILMSYYHGDDGGCWQRPSTLHEKETIERWIELPQV